MIIFQIFPLFDVAISICGQKVFVTRSGVKRKSRIATFHAIPGFIAGLKKLN